MSNPLTCSLSLKYLKKKNSRSKLVSNYTLNRASVSVLSLSLSLSPTYLDIYLYSQKISRQCLIEHVHNSPTTSGKEKAGEQDAQRDNNSLVEFCHYYFSHVFSSSFNSIINSLQLRNGASVNWLVVLTDKRRS